MLTNDAGQWMLLSHEEFARLLEGPLPADHPQLEELRAKCFVRDGADLDAMAARVKRRKSYVHQGPHLHVVVTTLRCNQSCAQAYGGSRTWPSKGKRMTEKVVTVPAGPTSTSSVVMTAQVGHELRGGK